MVGGTFGVAALGALFQHIARNDISDALAGTGVTAAQQERLVAGLGTASEGGGLPPAAADAAHNAFIHALSSGMWMSAGVAAVGVVVAFTLVRNREGHQHSAATAPQAAAAEALPAAR
jgi:hypothetical protein